MSKLQNSKTVENHYGGDTQRQRAIYSEISLLKRKIKLVEGERKAYYEQNEEELKKNEALIEEMRFKIAAAKAECETLRQSKDGYSVMIASILGDEKRASVFREKSFEEVQEILECQIGDAKNRLNLIKYKNHDMKEKMKALLKEEKQLEVALYSGNRKIEPLLKELREAENNGALMEMRIVEAENIQAKYKTMLATLKQENYTKGNKIRTLESTVLSQNKEVKKFELALKEALKACKIAREKLAEMEEQSVKEHSEREEKLRESRQELAKIRERMEEIGNKLNYPKFPMAHRDSSLADGIYFLGTTPGTDEGRRESLIERVYKDLVEMTGELDPEVIVERFHQQRAHAIEQEKIEAQIKSQVRKEKLRKRFLQDKLIQLQFSGGIKREMLDKEIAEIDDKIAATEAENDDAEKRIQDLNEVIAEAQKKLSRICNQNDILVPMMESGTVDVEGDRVSHILKIIFEKVAETIPTRERDSGLSFLSPTLSPDSQHPPLPTFSVGPPTDVNIPEDGSFRGIDDSRHGSVVSLLPIMDDMKLSPFPESLRVSSANRIRATSTAMSKSSKGDSSEEEEATSRNSIKRQSQVMVEAKTRKGRFKGSASPLPVRHFRSKAGLEPS